MTRNTGVPGLEPGRVSSLLPVPKLVALEHVPEGKSESFDQLVAQGGIQCMPVVADVALMEACAAAIT